MSGGGKRKRGERRQERAFWWIIDELGVGKRVPLTWPPTLWCVMYYLLVQDRTLLRFFSDNQFDVVKLWCFDVIILFGKCRVIGYLFCRTTNEENERSPTCHWNHYHLFSLSQSLWFISREAPMNQRTLFFLSPGIFVNSTASRKKASKREEKQ